MTVLNEGQYRGEFMISEANGFRSREEVTIQAPAADIEAGTVMLAGANIVPPLPVGGAMVVWDNVKATAPATDAVVTAIVRDAEVNGHDLIWPAPGDAPTILAATTALALVGIRVR